MSKNRKVIATPIIRSSSTPITNIGNEIQISNTDDYDKAKRVVDMLVNKLAEYEAKVEKEMVEKLGSMKSYEEDGWLIKVAERTTKVPLKPVEELLAEGNEFVKVKTTTVIDTPKVNEYLKKNGEMPAGIQLKTDRKLKLERVNNG